MKKEKGNGTVAVVIIVVVAIAAGVFAWLFAGKSRNPETAAKPTQIKVETEAMENQKVDETADWQIYRNEKYGFEFKYPSNWDMSKERFADNYFWIQLQCPGVKMGGEAQCPLQVNATKSSSPNSFLAEEFDPNSNPEGRRGDVSFGEINGIKTASFTNYAGSYPYASYITFFGSEYYVTFSDYGQTYKDNKIYDNILSTFKFIESIKNLQAYSNDQFGFQFQYPGEWKIDQERSSSGEVVFDTGIPEARESVKFFKNSKNLTLEQLKKQEVLAGPESILGQSEMMVGGEKALVTITGEFGQTFIVFNHGENSYVVTTGGRMIDEGVLLSLVFTK